jgi:aerobic-type carbon monoxide dehydrogenase small subunit (CoxS/CutS family)
VLCDDKRILSCLTLAVMNDGVEINFSGDGTINLALKPDGHVRGGI